MRSAASRSFAGLSARALRLCLARAASGSLLGCGLCLAALWSSACDETESAPPAPPELVDAGSTEDDAAPRPPIDCENSVGAEDADGDGFSRAKGDCDDCTGAFGPAAIEIPGNGLDEDCDGEDAPAPSEPCDPELEPTSTDAEDAARALGLCEEHSQSSRLPGLIEAQWLRLSDGAGLGDARQVWLPELFGTLAPREGERLLVLSTGVARDINDDDYTAGCDTFDSVVQGGEWSGGRAPPEGYPKDSSQCDEGINSSEQPAYNDVVLELTLRAPSNAKSFSFDSLFLTYEYPDFLCTQFNDFFVVFVDPAPDDLDDDNVLFDVNEDPVGVNSGLLAVCHEAERGRAARPVECTLGPALLAETGFDEGESTCATQLSDGGRDIGGASTGWLHTVVPVPSGKVITVRIVLWDNGDPLLDSSVVIDNFQWSPEVQQTGTGPITAG